MLSWGKGSPVHPAVPTGFPTHWGNQMGTIMTVPKADHKSVGAPPGLAAGRFLPLPEQQVVRLPLHPLASGEAQPFGTPAPLHTLRLPASEAAR